MGGRTLAIETALVETVVDGERTFFVPGGGGVVRGVTSHRGELVAVADLPALFGAADEAAERSSKTVIAAAGSHHIGLYIGRAFSTLLWKEELAGAGVEEGRGPFSMRFRREDGAIDVIDAVAVFERAAAALSAASRS